MKTIISIIFFFVTSLSYSQDLIVSYTQIRGNKERKQGTSKVEIDDGKNPLRVATIKAQTLLGVIKYFENEGFKVDVKIGQQGALNVTANVFYLFCYKRDS